jgi:hypothetical protein
VRVGVRGLFVLAPLSYGTGTPCLACVSVMTQSCVQAFFVSFVVWDRLWRAHSLRALARALERSRLPLCGRGHGRARRTTPVCDPRQARRWQGPKNAVGRECVAGFGTYGVRACVSERHCTQAHRTKSLQKQYKREGNPTSTAGITGNDLAPVPSHQETQCELIPGSWERVKEPGPIRGREARGTRHLTGGQKDVATHTL